MKMPKKTSFLVTVFLPIWVSCAPNIPRAEYPVQIEKLLNASFDEAWSAVSEVVEMSKGVLITSDKSSGFVTYAICEDESQPKTYVSVYLKRNPKTNKTTVLFFSHTRKGPRLEGVDRDFFARLKTILGE